MGWKRRACAFAAVALFRALDLGAQELLPCRDVGETEPTAAAVVHEDAWSVPRTAVAIEPDGRLDAAEWAGIAPVPLVSFEPVAGRAPSQPTEIRVAHDGGFLYVGALFCEQDPAGAVVNTYTRDRWANDDLLELLLDTYDDNETGYVFGVTPGGTRLDAQVRNDGEFTLGFPVDYSWNGFWDAAGRRTAGGWTAEMRIPFSTLRFQAVNGRVRMGLIVNRYMARRNETVTFPAIDPRWRSGFNKPSQGRDVVFEGVESSRPVYVSPYALAGAERATQPAGGEAERSTVREVGGDVRFGLSHAINVDLTLNTDFAQVEADDQQVNLTRFSLFFPEKRQFFQERASIFEFFTGRSNRLFHSRRIGIVDGGLAPIRGGVRVVGRAAGWDFGALNMYSGGTEVEPGEAFFVARTRRRVVNDHSYVGMMATSRGARGATDVAWGVDGSVRIAESRYVSGNWSQSLSGGRGSLASSAQTLMLEDRDRRGLGYRLRATRTGSDFDPAIGFVQRRDFRETEAELTYGFFPGDASPVRRWGPRLEGSYLVADASRAFESAEWSTGWETELKSGATINGGVVWTREHLRQPFTLEATATVPAGEYDFVWGRMFASSAPGRTVSLSLFAQVGGFYDGRIAQFTLSPRWRLPPFVELEADLERFSVRFADRDETFRADVARLRASVSLNRALSVDALVQYASLTESWSANARFRYFISEGRNLWLVVNGSESSAQAERSTAPVPERRTVLVKYVHTLTVR